MEPFTFTAKEASIAMAGIHALLRANGCPEEGLLGIEIRTELVNGVWYLGMWPQYAPAPQEAADANPVE